MCPQHFFQVRRSVADMTVLLQLIPPRHNPSPHFDAVFSPPPHPPPPETAQAAAGFFFFFFLQHLLLLSEESLGGLSAGHKSSGVLITLGRWRNALSQKSPLDY